VTVPAPTARSRFARLVASADDSIDLAMGALLVAAEEYPQLSPELYLRRLDMLAERTRDRLSDETAAPIVLQELSRVLFVEEAYRGNAESYYDPRNSFLNDVLDRKLGIPATLSIIYLEVGWRLGLPLEGVNFPGHFLIRYKGEALPLLVDPFQRGEIRFEDQVQDLLDKVYGGEVMMRPEYLKPAGRKDILVRLLQNLKGIYLNARDESRALSAIERILMIRPNATDELRDRGMLLARVGRVEEAMIDLQRYLTSAPDAPDATRVRMLLDELSRS
jgi:regulator of sirC expression with transglutaminase-like and TPR domain